MNLFLQKHRNCSFDNNLAFFILTIENKTTQNSRKNDVSTVEKLDENKGRRKTRSAQVQATIVIMTKKHTGIPRKSPKQLERTSTFVMNTEYGDRQQNHQSSRYASSISIPNH